VGDWLRDTGVTRRLRSSDAPNKLVEDLPWVRLLCAGCEARFSGFETAVYEGVFLPLHEGRESRFRYGPSFAKFAVSVAWRALAVLQAEGHLGGLSKVPQHVEAAERAWREFLLGQRPTPAPHDVHALPLDVPVTGDLSDFSPHFSRFLLRAVGLATQSHDGCGYVIVKMARLLFFGTIAAGSERHQWKATKLHAEGGSWGVEQYHLPGWVRQYLKTAAQKQQDLVEGLSVRQKRQTDTAVWQAIEEDVQGVAGSGSVTAFMNDLKLFGPAAFQDPISPDEDSG